jgi:hypothetical protein
VGPKPHAEGIHVYPATSDPEFIPKIYRTGIMGIIGKHARGKWKLVDSDWHIDGDMPPL